MNDLDDVRDTTGDADNLFTCSSPAQSVSEESVNEGGARKRPIKRGSADAAVMKDLTNLATSASIALTQLTKRKETETKHACSENLDDKDYMLAMLLYKKLKEIPEGDEKDELHIELQRLVNQTRRSINQNMNSVIHNRASYTREHMLPMQIPQAVHSQPQFVNLQPQPQASLNFCTPYPVAQFPPNQPGSFQDMVNCASYGQEARMISPPGSSFNSETGSNYTTL